MTAVRVFFLGGVLSYRALFNWTRPSLYIATVLGKPLFQLVFFTYLGRYSAVGDDRYYIIGNAVQSSAVAGLFGMVMVLANEREFGTLAAVLATPVHRFALFFGRTVPVIGNGLLISALGFGAGVGLGFRMPLAAVPALAGVVALTVVSGVMFGLAFGSLSMRARDLWVGSNLTYALMLLLCGGTVPPSILPGWLAAAGRLMPLTHGIQAARELAGGAGLADTAGLIGTEALTGLAYATLGYGLLRLFELESRRRATLDLT